MSKNAKPAEVAVEKEEIIRSRQATPKLFRTLVKVRLASVLFDTIIEYLQYDNRIFAR